MRNDDRTDIGEGRIEERRRRKNRGKKEMIKEKYNRRSG